MAECPEDVITTCTGEAAAHRLDDFCAAAVKEKPVASKTKHIPALTLLQAEGVCTYGKQSFWLPAVPLGQWRAQWAISPLTLCGAQV